MTLSGWNYDFSSALFLLVFVLFSHRWYCVAMAMGGGGIVYLYDQLISLYKPTLLSARPRIPNEFRMTRRRRGRRRKRWGSAGLQPKRRQEESLNLFFLLSLFQMWGPWWIKRSSAARWLRPSRNTGPAVLYALLRHGCRNIFQTLKLHCHRLCRQRGKN